MPLSENTKNRLVALFAISRIMRFGVLPGIIGFTVIGIGYYLQIDALIIVGFVLAIPILWVYFVITCICFPYLLVDSLRKSLKVVK
jgi:hypothetical protein